MNDLEITKLCAEEMEYEITAECEGHIWCKDIGLYAPLLKDEQAMALVKKIGIYVRPLEASGLWLAEVMWRNDLGAVRKDLNRAICECVAKMQQHKHDR